MKRTVINIKTFGCGECGYYQDFNSLDEPIKHARIFPNVPAGKCPACYTGQNDERVVRTTQLSEVIDLSQSIQTTTASTAELEAREVEDLDANGQPIMVESGEVRERLGIVDGKPAVIQEPVMVPKMVPLPKAEVDALKLQRNQSLDKLEAVAVKEVSEPAQKDSAGRD